MGKEKSVFSKSAGTAMSLTVTVKTHHSRLSRKDNRVSHMTVV